MPGPPWSSLCLTKDKPTSVLASKRSRYGGHSRRQAARRGTMARAVLARTAWVWLFHHPYLLLTLTTLAWAGNAVASRLSDAHPVRRGRHRAHEPACGRPHLADGADGPALGRRRGALGAVHDPADSRG